MRNVRSQRVLLFSAAFTAERLYGGAFSATVLFEEGCRASAVHFPNLGGENFSRVIPQFQLYGRIKKYIC